MKTISNSKCHAYLARIFRSQTKVGQSTKWMLFAFVLLVLLFVYSVYGHGVPPPFCGEKRCSIRRFLCASHRGHNTANLTHKGQKLLAAKGTSLLRQSSRKIYSVFEWCFHFLTYRCILFYSCWLDGGQHDQIAHQVWSIISSSSGCKMSFMALKELI